MKRFALTGSAVMLMLLPSAAIAANPPKNTDRPTLSGKAQAGQILTASPGKWTGDQPISYSYQWQRCGVSSRDCSDLPKETASSYQTTAADGGQRIQVKVTATNPAGQASKTSKLIKIKASNAPQNLSQPTILGIAKTGRTLQGRPGMWRGDKPISYSYQWQRCSSQDVCVDIAGANGKTYTPTSQDGGQLIALKVTATNPAGSASATSMVKPVEGAALPSPTTAPSIAGTVKVGRTVSARQGVWQGARPIRFSYQWQRCPSAGQCLDIVGASRQTYRVQASDLGSQLLVKVTASNTAGVATAVSDPVWVSID